MSKERDDAIFWAVIGTIILVSAFTWLGTESGWWEIEFPFWPVMFLWIGIAVIISAIRKFRQTD